MADFSELEDVAIPCPVDVLEGDAVASLKLSTEVVLEP